MSKMNEGQILEALNDSRQESRRFRSLRENYIGEDDELDTLDHFDDAEVDVDTDGDPDYDEINVHATTADPFDDIDTVIDDMDAIEPELFTTYDDEDDSEVIYWDDEDDYYDDDDEDEDDYVEIDVDVDDLGDEDILDIETDLISEKTKITNKKDAKGRNRRRRVKVSNKPKKRGKVRTAHGYRNQTAEEKAARKRSAKKMNRAMTAAKRHKAAVRAAKSREANESAPISRSAYTNEQAFMTLLNGVLADSAKKANGRFNEAKVVKVNKGYVKGNSIILECMVRNGNRRPERAKFVVSSRPNRRYTVTESTDFFKGTGLSIGGRYHMNESRFVFDSMGYTLKTSRGTINESFRVVNN